MVTAKPVRFDDAVPNLVRKLHSMDPSSVDRAVLLRSADGRVSVILPQKYLTAARRKKFTKGLSAAGGAYVDPLAVCLTPEDIFMEDIFESSSIGNEYVEIGSDQLAVRVLDNRIIAQDWSRINFDPIAGAPPTISFYSCKGGVGRSTAIAICAAGLAARGHDVLVVDLDIEAPGLGSLLVKAEDSPEYGAIDFLVEDNLSGVDANFVRNCISPASLIVGLPGSVDVLPAIGRRSLDYPHNLIAKLGRALLDDDGQPLVDQVRALISAAVATRAYGAIFVDVRSGLSESSAAALLSIGSSMLLFGVDTPQTFDSYRYLFAHFAKFDPPEDWRSRLQMVQAKITGGEDGVRNFRERASDLFAEFVYDPIEPGSVAGDAFSFGLDDDLAPHYPWFIEFDPAYLHFDPISNPDQLSAKRFERAFGPLIDNVESLIVGLQEL